MNSDSRLVCDDFPRSSAYHPDWVIEGSMGSNVLWLTEWLTGSMDLSSGMRVLDLGCGRGSCPNCEIGVG
jgi:cyclopropane fatty-acyl-phospholipid synthase-like methyltransferase